VPFSVWESIRSSLLFGTNISSSPKSASLIPYYPITIPHSRIRSSKNLAIFYSKLSQMPSLLLGAKTPSAFLEDAERSSQRGAAGKYPKQSSIDWIGGRVEPQLNGFYIEIAYKHPKGKLQLNESEGGFEPDLNYFFPTEANAPQYATPLPFRDAQRCHHQGDRTAGSGVRFKRAFELDSFRLCAAVKLRYPQAIHSPGELLTCSAVQKNLRVFAPLR
jgi:hypothetical protein